MEKEIEQNSEPELFKPEGKNFFTLLMESFKFFTLNLPAIATIVIPVYLVVEFLVPLIPIPDFADDLTGWKTVNNFFNYVIDFIAIEFIRQLIGGIAWIAVIRVVAGAMTNEKIQGVQALKDGINMLPMYFVTAVIYYTLLVFSSLLLVIPGIIFAVYCAFWQYSYVLRGKGAFSALTYSFSLVRDDSVRVFLNVFGIMVLILFFEHFLLEYISNAIAGAVDSNEGLIYFTVNAILMALGKVFELGIEIIFLMMLFMDLEKD